MKRTPEQVCHFNFNEYSYLWSTSPRKVWGQRRCPKCGLWTVHIHNASGLTASQCDGVETFWAQTRSIIALHEQRGSQVSRKRLGAAKRSVEAVGKRLGAK